MIQIRSYEPGDAAAIKRLHAESQVDVEANVAEDFFDDLFSIGESFAGGAFVVAHVRRFRGGEILVGMGGLFASGEVVRMRVAAQHRRQGIARLILRELIESAERLGFQTIHLHTLQEQRAAQALYLSCGFVEVDRGSLHGNAVVAYARTL